MTRFHQAVLTSAAVALFASAGALAAAKPAFDSKVISPAAKDHSVPVDVDIAGAKQLYLIILDGGDGVGCDWADWAEPRLVSAEGKELKLTELKWKSADAGWGQVHVNKNAAGNALKVAGKPVAYGIGAHANSLIVYDLPAGYVKFKARAALDNGGTNQGCGSTVQFLVFTEAPSAQVLARAKARSAGGVPQGGHEPSDAVANLDVGDGLQADLFAAEPMLLSPSNTDVDHRGRVWVCEIVNYRGHNGQRPEGDRILILEDSNGDGKADQQTVFYQGTDINSPHGVCVLATPDFKGTRVIVSAGDKVQIFTDADGDGKSDSKQTLFSGIAGVQHDHGIHAFTFGPDGKLYFNFGNAGQHVRDKDGKPIIDLAGNTVDTNRNPYMDGMAFRCNLDGSEVETLGWNFRNNWMVTVDSFGTVWQSDNDDDGNRGVRINFVMEFGNYGYRDEVTGAGWGDAWKKANANGKIPDDQKYIYHWHQLDPGVVPNLLNTGAGSPTGITVYEGDLLPPVFRNQIIHCDAGPNVVRAYPLTNDGAGYKARIVNILQGARDKWFRPSDVKVAPDGSLIVADWYDPGVGGHQMRDMDRGRIFRVTPAGHKGYHVPSFDFSTAQGAVEALTNPNYDVRQVAWTALHKMGAKAEPALKKLFASDNPRHRARALWLLGKIDGRGQQYVDMAIKDADANIRIVGLRLARQLKLELTPIVADLVKDPSPQVRRECAIALRFLKSAKADQLWAELALQHDGKDRWYLEALGIGSDLHADGRFAAWLKAVGAKWNTPAGRDIIWRSRSKLAPAYLAKIIKSDIVPPDQQAHYMRAFDFHKGPEKDEALKSILGL